MTKENQFTEIHQVTYYETDLTGQVTLAMLVDMAVLASYDQAEALGVGTQTMLKQGLGWVITQYEMQIIRLPRDREQLSITTEAVSNDRYFANRQFFVRDIDGNLLVHIKAVYVVMDLMARKMIAIPEAIIAPYQAPNVKRIPRLARPQKITTDETLITNDYHVRYFDLDTNHHVNNARYFDWLLDPLGEDFLTNHRLQHVTIRFENEVRYGHTITSAVTTPQIVDGAIATKHRIMGNDEAKDQTYAEAELTWLVAETVDEPV
ncbi:acyl-[acyl-carrier-protein] thioesterase [Furfurilactobacillus curtus]|uniref:Acyl-ACP thioesterase n=1 Tax=Furfurilactobacillus curtus TaxID=1746200 RepID=A0ABQ5JRT7_9LACO